MRLQGVYEDLSMSESVLFLLLQERQPWESISHRTMPTWDAHCAFVYSKPYRAWYLVLLDDGTPAGAVYLTERDEIGIGVLRQHRRKGLACAAVQEVMRLHHRDAYLANINPANEASLELFRGLGFDGPIQITLRKESTTCPLKSVPN